MPEPALTPVEILRWYLDAGVDETVAETPQDRFRPPPVTPTGALTNTPASAPVMTPAAPPPPAPMPRPSVAARAAPTMTPARAAPIMTPARAAPTMTPAAPPPVPDEAVRDAVARASAASTLEELRAALLAFEGCGLKRTATNLVFTDGNPAAPVLFVGEAPGAEEDRQGLPFVGASGRLLDRMLASIGLDRAQVCITNTVFWRPPGNRTPTTVEMAVCMPFLERLIELVDPAVLVTLGGPAAKAVLAESAGVSKLRGRWFSYSTPRLSHPIPATAMYHPAYLLRTPAQKRDAWRDLLALRRKLDESPAQ